jgi:hypothetical protein
MSQFESNKKNEKESSPAVNLLDIYNKDINNKSSRREKRAPVKYTRNPLLSSIAQQDAPPGTSGNVTPKKSPLFKVNWDSSTKVNSGGTKKSNKTYKKNRKHKRGGFTYKLKSPSRNHSKTHKKRNHDSRE